MTLTSTENNRGLALTKGYPQTKYKVHPRFTFSICPVYMYRVDRLSHVLSINDLRPPLTKKEPTTVLPLLLVVDQISHQIYK